MVIIYDIHSQYTLCNHLSLYIRIAGVEIVYHQILVKPTQFELQVWRVHHFSHTQTHLFQSQSLLKRMSLGEFPMSACLLSGRYVLQKMAAFKPRMDRTQTSLAANNDIF